MPGKAGAWELEAREVTEALRQFADSLRQLESSLAANRAPAGDATLEELVRLEREVWRRARALLESRPNPRQMRDKIVVKIFYECVTRLLFATQLLRLSLAILAEDDETVAAVAEARNVSKEVVVPNLLTIRDTPRIRASDLVPASTTLRSLATYFDDVFVPIYNNVVQFFDFPPLRPARREG